MMTVTAKHIESIDSESRKMRTTRGPGYTTLKATIRISVQGTDEELRYKSLTEDLETAAHPEEWKGFLADKVELTWGYWFSDENEGMSCYIGLHVSYFDRGHAARAASGRMAMLLSTEATARFLEGLVEKSLKAAADARRREEAAQKLGWMAAGIVSEAGRLAREQVGYDDKMMSLQRALATCTEKHAADIVSTVSREQEIDEGELKLAVETALSKPAFYIGRR